jgi:hypothetical protein
VTPNVATIYSGQSVTFKATALDASRKEIFHGVDFNKSFEWTADNPGALFNSSLILSGGYRTGAQAIGALTGGKTTVTAKVDGVSGQATLTVLVPTTLTLATAGAGGGTISADPVREKYTHDTQVTVTATPDLYSYLSGWSGGSCSGALSTCRVLMSQNRSVTANFAVQPFVGLWGASMTTVRKVSSGTCTWQVTFSSSSSVQVTYPPAAGGTRTPVVVLRTSFSFPSGTPSAQGTTCAGSSGSYTQSLDVTPGANGSFTAIKQVGPLLYTVTGTLTPGRTVTGNISIRYNRSDGTSVSGSASAAYMAVATTQAPPTP